MTDPLMEFHLSTRSGVAPYLQLIQQVHHALRLGTLEVGDQLPTVKTVVAALAINPNTVLKAYRQLEYEGLVKARPGVGTFVTRTLGEHDSRDQSALREELEAWFARAREAGMGQESIEALVSTVLNDSTPQQA